MYGIDSSNIWHIVIGLLVLGYGILSFLVPIYIFQIRDNAQRNRLLTASVLDVNLRIEQELKDLNRNIIMLVLNKPVVRKRRPPDKLEA